MVVNGRFIDDNWVMHKIILNFRSIDNHKGRSDPFAIGLYTWVGIKNVMTMTTNNATSDDKTIKFLIKKLPKSYDGGKHFHLTCMTHILNLNIKDELKDHNYHVECVQKSVRYISQLDTQLVELQS